MAKRKGVAFPHLTFGSLRGSARGFRWWTSLHQRVCLHHRRSAASPAFAKGLQEETKSRGRRTDTDTRIRKRHLEKRLRTNDNSSARSCSRAACSRTVCVSFSSRIGKSGVAWKGTSSSEVFGCQPHMDGMAVCRASPRLQLLCRPLFFWGPPRSRSDGTRVD